MNLLDGLSDFWLRFFADTPLLRTFYSGAMDLVEQAYLRLLESTLTLTLKDTPVFRKEFFKLLVFEKNTHTLIDNKYAYDITDTQVREFPFLYNKILAPSVILERYLDFEFVTQEDKTYVAFKKDLFNWDGLGNPIPGVARRQTGNRTWLSFWAPDVKFEASDLYVHYGYLVDRYAPSSEAYKTLLNGLYFFYMIGGPAREYIKSTLHIIVGLPVTEDYETLQSVDVTESVRTVITDKNRYEFHYFVPLRSDILDEKNWGTLQFRPFESLTTVFKVDDQLTDPAWFYGRLVSTKLAPEESADRREADPKLYENKINNPPGRVKIGDPFFYIGADDTGFIPSPGGRPPYRHTYGWWVYNILKDNILCVEVTPDILTEGIVPYYKLANELAGLLFPGKPVYVHIPVSLPLEFSDFVFCRDSLEVDVKMAPAEPIPKDPAPYWRIGDKVGNDDVTIGQSYYYYDNGNLVLVTNGVGFPGSYPDTSSKVGFFIGMDSFLSTRNYGLENKGIIDSLLEIRKL